jgi:hypothetical protein
MRQIRADFARRSQPGALWWWLCAALLLSSVVMAVLTLQSKQRAHALIERAAAAQSEALAARNAALRDMVPKPPPPYEASAREVVAGHSVPWPMLLAALEAVRVPGVRVTSIEYEAKRASARVEFAFDQQASMLKLVEELNINVPASSNAWRWNLLEMSQRGTTEAGRALVEARLTE